MDPDLPADNSEVGYWDPVTGWASVVVVDTNGGWWAWNVGHRQWNLFDPAFEPDAGLGTCYPGFTAGIARIASFDGIDGLQAYDPSDPESLLDFLFSGSSYQLGVPF